jgi:hypothetical protein
VKQETQQLILLIITGVMLIRLPNIAILAVVMQMEVYQMLMMTAFLLTKFVMILIQIETQAYQKFVTMVLKITVMI